MINLTDRWWSERIDPEKRLWDTVRGIAEDLSYRRRDDAHFLKMYGQRDPVGAGEIHDLNTVKNKLTYNMAKSAVGTAVAHIGALHTTASIITNDADWGTTRKAKACDHLIRGVFDQNDFQELKKESFKDATVGSLGGVKRYNAGGRVKLERIFPGEIIVDPREGKFCDPNNIYQCKLVHKDVLKAAFPGHEETIDDSARGDVFDLFGWFGFEDDPSQVMVIEAWHRGDLKDDGNRVNGKHMIAVQNGVITMEDWNRHRFPLAFRRWEKRQFGFYGMGIVEELRSHQRTINYIHMRIRDMMHWLSRGKMATDMKDAPSVEGITNAPWDVIKYKGKPPVILNQNAVPTEWWSWRREVIEDGYTQLGFNEIQRSGQTPAGVTAKVAMRELNDAGSRRFRDKVQEDDAFTLECARLVIDGMQEMSEKGEMKPVQTKVRKGQRTIMSMVNWSEVSLDDEEYRIEASPASALPDHSAGRYQTVQDWYAAGLINQREMKALLDMPDLERFKSLDLAAYENILDAIETMIEDGEYVFPEPTDDLYLIKKLATQSYNKFKLRQAPRDRLELLLRYIDDALALEERAFTAMQQQQQAQIQATAAAQQQLPGGAGAYEGRAVVQPQQLPAQGQPPALPPVA